MSDSDSENDYKKTIFDFRKYILDLRQQNIELKNTVSNLTQRLELLEAAYSKNLQQKKEANKKYYEKLKNAYKQTNEENKVSKK